MMARGWQSGQVLFAAGFLLYALVLIVQTRGLVRESRLFPLMVMVPLAVLLLLQAVGSVNRRVGRWLAISGSVVDLSRLGIQVSGGDGEERASAREVLAATTWVVAFVILMYLLGFYWTAFLYTLILMRVHGRIGLIASAIAAAALTGFAYVVFAKIMYIPLHEGWLQRLLQ
ncbi:MAG: tripartite tricarboxylate transporter TctB family protein [Armatimonadetes bacterium]|nr:tripartite tricarboxylate transporter TctB family protein [Armatimonadota bacterium]